MKALKGARPVPAAMKITFFHFIASVNVDFLNSALNYLGSLKKCFDINPFSTILAATITFFCVFACEAIVNNLGAIESDNSTKSSKASFT
jgi:hypothetical protein